LNESTIDNECCNILGEMVSLVMLNLNHCTKLESAGVLHLIKKLEKLNRIEALRGKSSNVQNALECLENKSDEMKTVANLTHMTFRDPHGISKIAAICPNIKEVKVIYNVYEYNYDANVDNCLVSLQLFNEHTLGNLRLSADFNCLNMLFVIQWRNLKLWGPALQKLTLTEPEFLHPQTLNPFALQCDKLTDLTIINPSTISDELFVGRVPELAKNPFCHLQKLRFEGEKLPLHVAKFLLTCSTNLCEITLIIDVLILAQFKDVIQLLIDNPRPQMKKASFYFSHYKSDESEEEPPQLSQMMLDFIHHSESLKSLAIYVRIGSVPLRVDVARLGKVIQSNNWDIDTSLEIVVPRHLLK